ncbi:ankyrin [Coprinopsis marcescibilis]|uniref:Ankyrin n=1 Tax=Coprinopsis marcescibilis TaxID=230819 RepID=A0A5C3L869_COPMA|nr:ankyrin [Coprinopsis marcescibilis]
MENGESETLSSGSPHLFQGASSFTINGGNFFAVGGDFNYSDAPQSNVADEAELDLDEVKVIAEWLTKLNHRAVWMDTIAQKAGGTGEWFVCGSQFEAWVRTGGSVLFGIGMPGAGKTVLAASVIEYLQDLADSTEEVICSMWAFFRYTDEISVKDMLASLVRQQLERHPCVSKLIRDLHRRHSRESTHPSKSELLALLKETSKLFARTFYCLDGLDEAPREAQAEVIQCLMSLGGNLFVTWRSSALTESLISKSANVVEVSAHRDDLVIIIDQAIDRDLHFRELLRTIDSTGGSWEKRVKETILENSRGMFLLASLQLEILQQCLHIGDLQEALTEMPSGITEFYAATLSRIRRQPQNTFLVAQTVFLWLLNARRPLTVAEFKVAVAICPKTHTFDADRIVHEDRLAHICCGLITVDREGDQVRLIHYTAFDALRKLLPEFHESPNAFIASACMQLLCDYDFPNSAEKTYHFSQLSRPRHLLPKLWQPTSSELHFLLAQHPLLSYSYTYWAIHARDVSVIPSVVLTFLQKCESFPIQLHATTPLLDRLQPVHVAAWYDLPQYVELLSANTRDPGDQLGNVNVRTTRGETALTLAAMAGNADIVKILLNVLGLDVHAMGDSRVSALMAAVSRGHAGVVGLLLGYEGVDANGRDDLHRTPLVVASTLGHVEVVKVLLGLRHVGGRRIDVNAEDVWGQTALVNASASGHEEVVRMLLNVEGVDVDRGRRRRGQVALMRSFAGETYASDLETDVLSLW